MDRNPFQHDASVEYEYQTRKSENNKTVKINRSSDSKRWRGYNLQPEKQAIYIGLNFYLPKIERRDLTIYTNKITKTNRIDDMDIGVIWVARILDQKYEEVYIQAVKGTQREVHIGMAKRFLSEYSENNMGFGEGRLIHIVRLLETCSPKSLIILEEPETSLHEFAQNQFANYLIDVSFRRGHQIIFSTHSSAIIDPLPTVGRIMLSRDETGVVSYSGMSSMYVRNALSGGQEGHLVVCVEDKFAKLFLSEIIRKKKLNLLQRVNIIPFHGIDSVIKVIEYLQKCGIKSIGVLDGDQSHKSLKNSIKCLPGNEAPEKDIFLSVWSKKVMKDRYDFDLEHHISTHPKTDHHDFSKIAHNKTGVSQEVIEVDCIRAYIDNQPTDYAEKLLEWIEEHT